MKGKKGNDMKSRKTVIKSLKKNWLLYVFILPALLYVILFCYWPMYGLQIAFKRYNFADGFSGSEWVGLYWFKRFLDSPKFWDLVKNTLSISLYSLIASFELRENYAECVWIHESEKRRAYYFQCQPRRKVCGIDGCSKNRNSMEGNS